MKEYFKYFSIEQLKQQIKNRFAGAKVKIDRIHQPRIEQSVDRKFYDYVSQIKSKQKQYDSIFNQPTQLNFLLKKRRHKINQSLQKYQRNIKCKTFSDFKLHQSLTFNQPIQQNQQNQPIQPNRPFHFKTVQQQKPHICQALPFELNRDYSFKKQNNPYNNKSKTQASFFIPNQKRIDNKQRQKQERHLKSITKVINITVNSQPKIVCNNKIFSFAKTSSKLKQENYRSVDTNIKKTIRFETYPIQKIQQTYQQIYKNDLKSCFDRSSINHKCVKKIKQRIQFNFDKCQQNYKKHRPKIKELELDYEQNSINRLQLKNLILSSSNIYHQLNQNDCKL